MGDKFPGSPLRMQAFGVLTASAWEQRRYRTAALNAQHARAELATATKPEELDARARLGVLEAEAWFRAGDTAGDAGDFRSAADAYAAALRERPAGVKAVGARGIMTRSAAGTGAAPASARSARTCRSRTTA